MNDVLTPEQRLHRYLGSIADSVKADNFFQAAEDVAALKKLLKGQASEAAVEVQKLFPDIADAVKKRQKEPALQRVRAAMTIVERWLP
jgi:hypothetical protein